VSRLAGVAAVLILVLVTGVLGGRWLARPPEVVAPSPPALSVTGLLGTEEAGFERAMAPRVFSFPADHGPHPRYRAEWWYFSGHLRATGGQRFGFQLTFFRFALPPPATPRRSAWAADQVYLAHFTLTDPQGRRFHVAERSERAALGLAGARAEPFRVWVRDWSAEGGSGGIPPLRLRARSAEAAIDLRLARGKPPVLNGERGLSRKGAAPGNASYYYSLTRLPASGTVHAGGRRHEVRGSVWLDREWGSGALGAGQVGWDWFAVQLTDGRELMYYRLRRGDGSADPASAGTLVEVSGAARRLAAGDVLLEVTARWTSPASAVTYPVGWRLRVPTEGLDLRLVPLLEGQEIDASVRYWEGAARVVGSASGVELGGDAYIELVGYR